MSATANKSIILPSDSPARMDSQSLWDALTLSRAERVQAMEEADSARYEALLLRDKIRMLEQECSRLKRTVEENSRDFLVYQGLESAVKEQRRSHETEFNRLKASLEENFNKRIEEQKSEIHSLSSFRDALESDLERKEAELEEFRLTAESRISTLQAELIDSRRERDRIEGLLHDRIAREDKEQEKIRKATDRLERQRKRLRSYATALGKEKKEIRRHSLEMVEKLQAARAFHPLKDYLALTEFELSRLEIQLRKTPEATQDRSEYEAAVVELVRQRDFLRSLVEASDGQIDQHLAGLLRIAQDESLESVPPPPPKASPASEA